MKVVRDSKFRHVFGEATKQKYEDFRLSSKATESLGIRANGKFFAAAWESGGGGQIAVVPSTQFGRLPRDLKLIVGHTGPILDFEFNPFDDNMLVTASEDHTIKLWTLPDEGFKEHVKEPLAVLEGHQKKVVFSAFNPSAGNILASTSFDFTVKTWNLDEQAEAFGMEVPDHVNHLKWNYTGSLLAATCKDKKMRIIDPRTPKVTAVVKIHEGVKAAKVEWCANATATDYCSMIVTTGFSNQAERQIGYWDSRVFSDSEDVEPLNMLPLDQGTGALFPLYDEGTNMLYIAGKGDGNIRYFEATPEDPYLHFISQFGSTVPQKGFCFLPKRCVDVTKHEVMRGLKIEATAVQPISFKVPRKSEHFQDDLFPDCAAGRQAMSAEQWVSGAQPVPPLTRPMKPGSAGAADAGPASPKVGVVSVKDLKKQLEEANLKIASLEKENSELKAEVAKLKGGS